MADGVSSDCEIVPTGDGRTFHLRVRLSSPPPAKKILCSRTVLDGCSCTTGYLTESSTPYIRLGLFVDREPALEAAAKVCPHMVLLDKTGSPAPSVGTVEILNICRPGYMDCACKLKAQRDRVKAKCVMDDYFVVLCSVDIDWAPPAPMKDLGHDLAMMLDNQDLTDVSFDVRGESFSAHRLVLVARSSVLRAELYGPMVESQMMSITIQDMEASTFRSMLHYIYHSSLPEASTADVSSTLAEYQHLLVAADRYRLERLKKKCEDKLCANGITIDSVVSLLELAEGDVCSKLKARCIDFLADSDNFRIVGTSDEYLRVMQAFPTLFVEVRNRLKIPQGEPTIIEPPASSAEEQLLDLGHDMAMMLDNQDLTDVSFDVGGESFSAHRLVLAARSPVFKAELYGPMAESMMTSITIQGMEASTFGSLLHYMYHGSLSDAHTNDVSSTMAQCQHLLVAADRYRVEELKKICEGKLCGSGIMIDNVVSMLELAEDHDCLKLKTECFDFLANGENFKIVATSAEYLHLIQSYPSFLVEMRNRFKIAHEESTTMNPGAHKRSRVC